MSAEGQFLYIDRKVAHLRRASLISAQSTGRGANGGACPDWLREEQKSEAKAASERNYRARLRHGGRQPDIEWDAVTGERL